MMGVPVHLFATIPIGMIHVISLLPLRVVDVGIVVVMVSILIIVVLIVLTLSMIIVMLIVLRVVMWIVVLVLCERHAGAEHG